MLQMLNQNVSKQMPQMQGNNPMQMMQQFQKFAKGITPQGAKEQVEQLLQSGQMSQEQFQKLSQMANQMQSFLK